MAIEFEFDTKTFEQALRKAPEAMFTAAKRGMHDAMDEWQAEAVDVAPLSKGTLRRGIDTDVTQNNAGVTGEITAVAIESSPKWPRFNYAYYIHEIKGTIKNPTTPGTTAKFIDEPAEQNKAKWLREIENELAEEARKLGF